MQVFWRHHKGTLYQIVNFAVDEATCAPAVVYVQVNEEDLTPVHGHQWVRPAAVFFDGRFSQHIVKDENNVPKEGDNFKRIGEIIPKLKSVDYPDFVDESFIGKLNE